MSLSPSCCSVHIDFGDCFEVACHREKYPEKIPFRLTRMLVNAMEVSGIDGTFRTTSETVMHVLRKNKNSVMAVLEAFVYDPLINWRLLETAHKADDTKPKTAAKEDAKEAAAAAPPVPRSSHAHELVVGSAVSHASLAERRRSVVEIEQQENRLLANTTQAGVPPASGASGAPASDAAAASSAGHLVGSFQNEQLNDKAVAVISRVESKLKGTDFAREVTNVNVLDVPGQVQRLILEATSHINLCQSYIGWCPFW